jgi:hypothetical protein
LQAKGSRIRPASRRAHQEGEEAVQLLEALLQRVLQGVALAQPPLQEAAGRLGVVVGVEVDALRLQLRRMPFGLDSEPLCTRQKSSPA